MFENLTNKLGNVFNALKKRGALTEKDVDEALRDVRVALLEADVSLEVVKDFIIKVRERAVGQEVLKSVTPGQQVVKIVNDVLIDALGTANSPLEINHSPPVVMLLVGLQGSGKTTTAGKLALYLREKQRKKANIIDSMELIGNVEGKNVVLVDDMVDTAGTLTKAADLMMDSGANSVRAICTHGVLSGEAYEKIENSK